MSSTTQRVDEVSLPQAARLAEVHDNTISNWIYGGRIRARKTGLGRGRWRIDRADLERFVEEVRR